MNSYLQISCGPYRLLLDIAQVIEVGEARTGSGTATHRPWRERNLPVVNLNAELGLRSAGVEAGLQQVVVRSRLDDTQLTVVDVEHIDRLIELPETELVDVAEVTPELARCIDRVWFDSSTHACLLRLRCPFWWESGRNDGEAPHE